MIAYKLVRLKKNGDITPLFINKQKPIILNEWLHAGCYPTKGFAVRKGWHCTFTKYAPHLKMDLANGERRAWVKCEVKDYKIYDRPESQGGQWILADMIRFLEIEER